jgi:LuxR family maltose regulon positive regulatory protein
VRGGGAALIGLAAWRRGDLEAARSRYAESMASLRRAGHVADTFGCALVLAEPEDYVRTFVDEGAPMAPLLSEAAKRGPAPSYARRLLAALGVGESRMVPTQDLVEPLSERELDVLRLLETHLNGPDIARELVVSVNTLRTHTKNIYAKPGVSSRRAAARRAEGLDLLS